MNGTGTSGNGDVNGFSDFGSKGIRRLRDPRRLRNRRGYACLIELLKCAPAEFVKRRMPGE